MIMPRPYKEGAPDPVRIKMARGSSIDFMKSTTSIYEGNFVLNGQEYTIAQFHAYGGKSSGATFNLIGYGSKMAYVCKTTSVYLPESYR